MAQEPRRTDDAQVADSGSRPANAALLDRELDAVVAEAARNEGRADIGDAERKRILGRLEAHRPHKQVGRSAPTAAPRGETASLEQVRARVEQLECEREAVQSQFDGLERVCRNAQEVQVGLSEFVSRLAEAGDATQQKISVLLEAIEAASDERERLNRANVAAREQAEKLERGAESAIAKLASAIDSHSSRIEEAARERSSRLKESADEILRRIESARDDLARRVAHLADEVERRLERDSERCFARATELIEKRLTAAEERLKAITAAGDTAVSRIEAACGARLRELEQAARRHETQIVETISAKGGSLNSHVQAAQEAARMVSGAAQSAHEILSGLLREREAADARIATLGQSIERAESAMTGADAVSSKLEPFVADTRACIEGSSTTIQKIERLIEDVWTLTTTSQQRAAQLAERCEAAESLARRMTESQQEAESCIRALGDENAGAREHIDELGGLLSKSQDSIELADAVAKRSGTVAGELVAAIDSAKSAQNGLASATEQAASMIARFESVRSEADAARELLEQLNAAATTNRSLADEIQRRFADGESQVASFDASADRFARAKKALDESTLEAENASREVASLLASFTERQGILESSDQALTEFLERAENIRIKLQQLQTRADAYQHQLNSMLSDPRKLVEEAKTQAGQLDGVCRAVRKVFSGLSQASLQANRDITRFGQISREANGRLTQLSAETQRAGQTLREWIDEALHIQSRLAKSLAQVPSLNQTHPMDALEELARSSTDAIPEILKPSTARMASDPLSVDRAARASGASAKPPARSEFAELIRHAEGAGFENI